MLNTESVRTLVHYKAGWIYSYTNTCTNTEVVLSYSGMPLLNDMF